MVGSQGTGKTLLTDAVCLACHPHFRSIAVTCADLVHKVVGESEKRIAALFAAGSYDVYMYVDYNKLTLMLVFFLSATAVPLSDRAGQHRRYLRTGAW